MGNDEADDAPPEAKRARVEPDTTTMSEPSQGAVVAEVPATHSDAATHATAAGEVTQEERGGRGGRSGRGVQGGRRGRGGRSAYKGKKADRRGEDKPEDERVERGPRPQYAKRKVALYFAYLGVGYHGMQRNPGVVSIEDVLEQAIFEAGGISEDNRGDFSKVNWTRAARTDKGVSAVGQLVALKCIVDPPGLVDRINAALPAAFRCFGFTRVTNGFNAKNLCDKRRYEYVLPSFAFDPSVGMAREDSAAAATTPATTAAAASPTSSFVFDDGVRARLNALLKRYVGTHNFHNFTIRVPPKDPSAIRVMRSFEAFEPFEIDGQQLVRMVVVGNSFMLHQIRKMVGLVVVVMRGLVSEEAAFEHVYSPEHAVPTPMAPELGLYLDEAMYTGYSAHRADTHEPVTLAPYAEQVAAFKAAHIYPHIVRTEAQEHTVANWLRELNTRNLDLRAKPISNEPPNKLPPGAQCAQKVGQFETYGLKPAADGGRGEAKKIS